MQQNALVALLIGITLVVIGTGWAGHCIYDRHVRLGIKNDRAHVQGQNGPRDLERGHGSRHIPDYTHDAWIRPSRKQRTPYIAKPGYVTYKLVNRGVNTDWTQHDSRPHQEDKNPFYRKGSPAPRQKQRKQQQGYGNKSQGKKKQRWKNKQNKKNRQNNQDHSYWGNTNNYQGNQNDTTWENTNNNDNNDGGGYQNGNANQSHKGSSSQKEDNPDEWRPKSNQSRKSHSQNQDGSDRQYSKNSWGGNRNENDRQSHRTSRGIPQRRHSLMNYGDAMDSQVGWGSKKEDGGEPEVVW
ncbi:uncharacterized protein N7498_008892 [Penicillium cinerascens]|uniref:Uncharacterized protein n=1 Tax=Penicillium cinerascens TaxID=70096 RepID=A0A9W9JFK1_9EURO|nr:uncharacterized protein N7498_008892 [Penicillium cinerascens]KAJ5195454.1 hypothetical protein N7498_008892 [Penicillium cinerascens]